MDEGKRGTIRMLFPKGGIIALHIEDESGHLDKVYGDNGTTVRSLRSILGPEITMGFLLNLDLVIGREITYDVGPNGLLNWIGPAE